MFVFKFDFFFSIHASYVATIQQFVNAPPKNIVLPRSHSINIVLNSGLAIQVF